MDLVTGCWIYHWKDSTTRARLAKDTSYDSILVVVDRFTKMIHSKPAQMPIDAPRLPDSIDWDSVLTSKSWSPGTTFKLDCGYHLCVFYDNIQKSHDRMQKEPSALACDIANHFPPDL